MSNRQESLLLKNARLIDGTGAKPKEGMDIRVEAGRIARIGEGLEDGGTRVVDVAGATVLPGLIDAHVHLESVPGSYYRNDGEETLWEQRKHQLKAYPACGVTTVLDCGISVRQLRQFQNYLAGDGVGPRVLALAPIFYPPGGYGDKVEMPQWGPFHSTGTTEQIEERFAEYDGLDNIIGTKMTLEPGVGPARVWPIHDAQMREAISRAAKARSMPLHVHALKPPEQELALDMGAYCLAHAAFFHDEVTDAFIERLLSQGTYVTTTLASTVGQNLVMFDLGKLDDPLLKMMAPPMQLETARTKEAWKATMFQLFRVSMPGWMPDFLIRFLLKISNLEKELRKQYDNCCRAIRTMHVAGVPIVAGTDSANWPLFLNNFHGPSLLLELEMLQGAGMAPMDVISSATQVAARMLHREEALGTIEEGKAADLIACKADPLLDLKALRKLEWVMKGGELKTPAQWIA